MIGKFVKWSKRKYTKKQKIIGFVMAGLAFLVVVPFILASASPFIDTKLNLPKLIPEPFNFIIASFFIVFGLLFSVWSGFAQFRIGRGTPVPVIPTQKLVTTGPYALCRNPMLLGSVIYYSGISLWLSSLSAVIITALFLLCSAVYIKLVEEKKLEARFGMEYEEYKRKTPFLIPRLRKVKQHSSRVFETKKLIKMNAEEKIYEKGLEKYPVSFIIGQNIFLFIYFGIGFIGMLPLRIHGFPIISVLYSIFLITMLLFVLRKHLCTNCYYYGKLCNTGWGKISALMFSKNSGNYQLGIKLANITWIVATMLPIAGIIGVLILNYSIINLILFTLFILLTPVNFVIHKKACEKCKMRLFCPASMAKGVKMDLYGFEVKVVFLVHDSKILAYAWHYDEKRALKHLKKIVEFHNLKGKAKRSIELENWLKKKINDVVIRGIKFSMPNFEYRNRTVYENIIKIPKGKTATYAQIARVSKVKYTEMLITLMRNPFQILIPCHRLLTNKGSLFGFYPLGKKVKKRLLEIEGPASKW